LDLNSKKKHVVVQVLDMVIQRIIEAYTEKESTSFCNYRYLGK